MTTNPSSDFDDAIDLRAILLTLWTARRVILIVTLAGAVSAFAVSFWILPRQYQATAYVFIGNPIGDITQASGLTISPTLPNPNVVVEWAAAPGLLESVTKDPAVAAAIGEEKITFADMVTAVYVGTDQLSLQVIDTNPQRAALLANTWAEKVTAAVNANYKPGALAQALDSLFLQSQQNYNQAQAVLEEALSQSHLDVLNAQLRRVQTDLKCVLDSNSLTMRVLDDLQFFEQTLSGTSGEAQLLLGDGLALTTLRQRSLTSQPCQLEAQSQAQFQLESQSSLEGQSQFTLESHSQSSSVAVPSVPDFTVQIDSFSFTGFTVSEALAATSQMRAGLESQLTRLQSDQNRLEQEIPLLRSDVEHAQAQLNQLTTKRDQSKELYIDLLQMQHQVTTVLTQNVQMASLSAPAVPTKKAVSQKTLLNTLLAGMLGLMLAVCWVILQNWWRNNENDEQENQQSVDRMQKGR